MRVVPVCGREFVIQGHMESVPSVGRIPSVVVRYARDTPPPRGYWNPDGGPVAMESSLRQSYRRRRQYTPL
jgi:hypothetical protein